MSQPRLSSRLQLEAVPLVSASSCGGWGRQRMCLSSRQVEDRLQVEARLVKLKLCGGGVGCARRSRASRVLGRLEAATERNGGARDRKDFKLKRVGGGGEGGAF